MINLPLFTHVLTHVLTHSYTHSLTHSYTHTLIGSSDDIIQLLQKIVTNDDFVVLKFDVDPNKFAYGPTMEWGFLFDLSKNQNVVQLVDEL